MIKWPWLSWTIGRVSRIWPTMKQAWSPSSTVVVYPCSFLSNSEPATHDTSSQIMRPYVMLQKAYYFSTQSRCRVVLVWVLWAVGRGKIDDRVWWLVFPCLSDNPGIAYGSFNASSLLESESVLIRVHSSLLHTLFLLTTTLPWRVHKLCSGSIAM